MPGTGSTMCSNSLNTWDFKNPLRLNNLDHCSGHGEFKTQWFHCQCPSSHGVNFHIDSLVSAAEQSHPNCTEPGWGLLWQKSLGPGIPDKALPSCWTPQGMRPPSPALWTLAGIALETGSCFHPDFLVHTQGKGILLLVSGIAGRCLGIKLTWLRVSPGTEQQEKNGAERYRNFFHSILCCLFWAIRRGRACVNGWWEDLLQFLEGPSG